MKNVLLLLAIMSTMLIFPACKKTKTPPAPTGSVSGMLHFRNFCTLSESAPVSPSRTAYSPQMVLMNNAGETVGTSSVVDGGFTIGGIRQTGSYVLRVSTEKPTGFYAEGTTMTINVSLDSLNSVDLGNLCLDNERPKLWKMKAGFPSPMTVAASPGAILHLPRENSPYSLEFETTDNDGNELLISVVAMGAEIDSSGDLQSVFRLGTIEVLGEKATWYADASTADRAGLLVTVRDEHGGDEQHFFPVTLHDSILVPAPFVKAYDFADSLHIDALSKSSSGQKAYWSRSTCCLVAVQNYTLAPHTLEASDMREYFAGAPITVSTNLTVHNLAGDVNFGLRMTDATSGNYLDWGVQNGSPARWELKHNGIVVSTGDLGSLYGASLNLQLDVDPLAGAVKGTIVVGGSTHLAEAAFSELFTGDVTVKLRSESSYSGAESAVYLEFANLQIEGADPSRFAIPVRFGQFEGEVYDDSQFGGAGEMYVVIESGVYFGETEVTAPLTTVLNGYLVRTSTGFLLTVLSDSEMRVSDWMSGDSVIVAVEPGVVFPINGAPFFLY